MAYDFDTKVDALAHAEYWRSRGYNASDPIQHSNGRYFITVTSK